MSKKLLLIGLSILFLLLVSYYFLGGFNAIHIQQVNANNYVVAGKSYQGPFQENLLKEYFLQMKEYVARDQLKGTVSVVDYRLENGADDSVHQLIGVVMTEVASVPKDIQVDTLFAQQSVRAVVQAHPIVMPRPDQVIRKIKAYAEENNLLLREYAIEQYVKENEIWVDIPLAHDIY